jgi:uncharacterized membrane protein
MERAWKKSLSWNVIAFSITTIICYLVTGKVETAGIIAIIERVIKIIAYTYHEKFWEKVSIPQ